MDFTVSTSSPRSRSPPANGCELVLFDINRSAKFGPLLRRNSETMLARLLPPAPRNFRTAIISNEGPGISDVVERVVEAGSVAETVRPLGLTYPSDIFSLSHVALPFPLSDPLYGLTPDNS
jgi:hypothetical protein